MKTIAIIGLGNMGSAIQKLLQEDFEIIGINRQHGALEDITEADIIVLAVKPQSFDELAKELKQYVNTQTIISIMAGVTIDAIASILGVTKVVRTMPNLALAKGQSLTAWLTHGGDVDTNIVQRILNTWGSSMQLDNEAQFDAFTAVVGSGPAYFFELTHQLERAAIAQGFNEEQARQMSMQTLRGAASVLDDRDNAGDWVKRVASKGGTTEAAFKVFSERHFGRTIQAAVEAAIERSREFGRG
jgi:pyrroline-5-carboxylate reductase